MRALPRDQPEGLGMRPLHETCPINKVVDADGGLLTRGRKLAGHHAMWLKPVLVPISTWLTTALKRKRNPARSGGSTTSSSKVSR